jgi:hydrogenase expression/formation protein HypC
MCLAVPGRVVAIDPGDELLRMARVDFGGVVRQASLAYLPEAGEGDYVLVHAGFAISRLDEDEARATLALLAELDPAPEPEGPA